MKWLGTLLFSGFLVAQSHEVLPNGLAWTVIEDHRRPTFYLRLLVEPKPEIPGERTELLHLAAQLVIDQVTRVQEQARDLAELPVRCQGHWNGWRLQFEVSGPTESLEAVFQRLAAGMRSTDWELDQVERLRMRFRLMPPAELALKVAHAAFEAALQGRRLPALPTEAVLARARYEDVVVAHRALLDPTQISLEVVGDLEPAHLRTLALKAFGTWSTRGTATSPVPEASRLEPLLTRVGSAEIHLGWNSPSAQALAIRRVLWERMQVELGESCGISGGPEALGSMRVRLRPFSEGSLEATLLQWQQWQRAQGERIPSKAEWQRARAWADSDRARTRLDALRRLEGVPADAGALPDPKAWRAAVEAPPQALLISGASHVLEERLKALGFGTVRWISGPK